MKKMVAKKAPKKYATGGAITTTSTNTTKKPTNGPTYKNLGLARTATNNAAGRDTNTPATKKDSLDYKKGFEMGITGYKPNPLRIKYEGKNQYEEKGRWEGQNTKKKTGGTIKKAANGATTGTDEDAIKVSERINSKGDNISKYKSTDKNYKMKIVTPKGSNTPSSVTERRTIKGFLTGKPKAQGKVTKDSFKSGGTIKKAKSGTSLGMKSVKVGFDKNPGVTRADFVSIGKGKAKSGASMKKCKYGCK